MVVHIIYVYLIIAFFILGKEWDNMIIHEIKFKKQKFKWILAFIIDFIVIIFVSVLYQAIIYIKQLLLFVLRMIDYYGHIKFWFELNIINMYNDLDETHLYNMNYKCRTYFTTDSKLHKRLNKRMEIINKNNNYTYKNNNI